MKRDELSQLVRTGYDRLADVYVERFFDELARKPFDRELLDEFAKRVGSDATVCEIGCGPAQISRYLRDRGIDMQGIDISEEMVARARALNPEMIVNRGDMLALDAGAESWGGIVAFYSIIHLLRRDVPTAFGEFARVLSPGGFLLLCFHAGEGEVKVDDMLDQPVPMVATLFSADEIKGLLETAGFAIVDVRSRPAYDFEYNSERVYVTARKPDLRGDER